jgi:hypothetical protein
MSSNMGWVFKIDDILYIKKHKHKNDKKKVYFANSST